MLRARLPGREDRRPPVAGLHRWLGGGADGSARL